MSENPAKVLEVPERRRISFLNLNRARIKIKLVAFEVRV